MWQPYIWSCLYAKFVAGLKSPIVIIAWITLNKNCVPNEKRSPMQASGVRIGTAAMTTHGFTAEDFRAVAHRIDAVIKKMMAENQ